MLRCGNATPRPSRFPNASVVVRPATRTEGGSTSSYFLHRRPQDSFDQIRHAIPLLRFRLQFALTACGEPVVFRFALVLRLAPFAGDPSLMFQAIQCGI